MSMAHKNIAAAIGLLVFAGWFAVMTAGLPERAVMPNTPGPSFFPWLITAALCALSVTLLFQGIIRLKRQSGAVAERQDVRISVLALASMAVYLAALPYLGFVPASVLFFAALMWLYGSRNPFLIAAGAIFGPLILFVVFRHGFNILLPRGIW
ncbi:MAG TPA: tripartite tricarboxylate transporter TctB family protein [Afifellaceae bacterium]|nr:tripartite tricarboxylate transporter TctB family protein [Afifellaceae bacterium]